MVAMEQDQETLVELWREGVVRPVNRPTQKKLHYAPKQHCLPRNSCVCDRINLPDTAQAFAITRMMELDVGSN